MKINRNVGPWGWVARIWSLLTIAFCLLFFFGEGDMTELGSLDAVEYAMFACMGVQFVGMVTGWWKEGLASLLVIASLLAFYVIDMVATGTPPSGIWFVLLAVPGFIWFFCWRKSARAGSPAAV